jgi:hypothetical protein
MDLYSRSRRPVSTQAVERSIMIPTPGAEKKTLILSPTAAQWEKMSSSLIPDGCSRLSDHLYKNKCAWQGVFLRALREASDNYNQPVTGQMLALVFNQLVYSWYIDEHQIKSWNLLPSRPNVGERFVYLKGIFDDTILTINSVHETIDQIRVLRGGFLSMVENLDRLRKEVILPGGREYDEVTRFRINSAREEYNAFNLNKPANAPPHALSIAGLKGGLGDAPQGQPDAKRLKIEEGASLRERAEEGRRLLVTGERRPDALIRLALQIIDDAKGRNEEIKKTLVNPLVLKQEALLKSQSTRESALIAAILANSAALDMRTLFASVGDVKQSLEHSTKRLEAYSARLQQFLKQDSDNDLAERLLENLPHAVNAECLAYKCGVRDALAAVCGGE